MTSRKLQHTKRPRPSTSVPTSQPHEGTTVQADPVTEDPSDPETLAPEGPLVQNSHRKRHSHPPRPRTTLSATEIPVKTTPVAEVTTGQSEKVTTEVL